MRFLGKNVIAAALGLAAVLFISSCEDKKSGDKMVEGMGTDKKPLALAKIEFETQEHDFGKIDQGQVVEYVFKFKNVGDNPLVVSEARASCGCTIPEWTRTPIQPGEEGKIDVKYDSKGRKGLIHKTVTVYANTEPKETILNIQAEVIEKLNGPYKN